MYTYTINNVEHFSPNREYAMGTINTCIMANKPKKIKLPKIKSFKKLKGLRNKMRRQQ